VLVSVVSTTTDPAFESAGFEVAGLGVMGDLPVASALHKAWGVTDDDEVAQGVEHPDTGFSGSVGNGTIAVHVGYDDCGRGLLGNVGRVTEPVCLCAEWDIHQSGPVGQPQKVHRWSPSCYQAQDYPAKEHLSAQPPSGHRAISQTPNHGPFPL
jgi:hypothetical protein